jgi:acyl-CoA dehydrogenase
MRAAAKRDVAELDAAFFGHVGFVFTNIARSLVLALTNGAFASVPRGGETGRALKRITRWSASFALVSDVAMGTLGGTLKRKEKITGRLADALAWMYVASAATKRFVDDGEPERDRALWRWTVAEAAYNVKEALRGVLDNLPNRLAANVIRPFVFPLGARAKPPGDRLSAACARSILEGGAARESLTRDMYVPSHDEPGLGRLEKALALTLAAEPARKKLREAVKARTLPREDEESLARLAREKNVLDAREAELVLAAARARDEAIQVDDFAPESLGKSEACREEAASIA